MSNGPLIELRGITRHFQLGDQTVRALDGIDLTVNAGEYLSVMGPSGSGKSTLLNMIGLLDRPDAGSYRLAGSETARLAEEARARLRRERIGFVFQSFHLVPRLTAQENIELPMVLAELAPARRRQAAQAVMERLGLLDRARHRPHELSGGQRQRVAIARALVMRPALLLADEPTGTLDSRSGADVVGLLEELNAGGITLLVVTHDPLLGGRARRCLRMVDGRIEADEVRAGAAG
jgi:putative ABC transport system ATP-binding protein